MEILLEIIIKLNTYGLGVSMEIFVCVYVYVVLLPLLLLLILFSVMEKIRGTKDEFFT